VKALSVRQPWAHAIFYMGKDVENRSCNYRYRGPIFVHAGKTYDRDGAIYLQERGVKVPSRRDFLHDGTLGRIIGIVTISDCVPEYKLTNSWAAGPYCLMLENPLAFEYPFKYQGRLGIFNVDMGLVASKIRNGDGEALARYLNIKKRAA